MARHVYKQFSGHWTNKCKFFSYLNFTAGTSWGKTTISWSSKLGSYPGAFAKSLKKYLSFCLRFVMFKSTLDLYPGIHPDCKPKHEPEKPASQMSKVACLNSHLCMLRYMKLCSRIVAWILETFKAWTKLQLGNSFGFKLHLLKKRDNLTLISNVFI